MTLSYRAAVHEAGHVIVLACAPHVAMIFEVVLRHERPLGITLFSLDKKHGEHPLEDAVIALGGHAAELLVFGAADDEGGLADIIGACHGVALARRTNIAVPPWPEQADKEIWDAIHITSDNEDMLRVLRQCHGKATELLERHRPLLHEIADMAYSCGVVDFETLRQLTEGRPYGF